MAVAIENQLNQILVKLKNQSLTSQKTYLDKKEYKCNTCKDEEWIFDKETNTARQCKCYEKRQYERILENSGIADAVGEKTIENYDPERLKDLEAVEQARENKEKVIRYLKEFSEKAKTRENSLALLGQVGSGKTHLSMAVANELMNNNIGTLYMDYREVLPKLKSLVIDEINYANEMNRYKRATVLLIDDLFKGAIYRNKLGEKYLNGADERIMFEIINYRYLNKKPIIFSSEYTIDQLLYFDEAIGSRILEMCKGNIRQFNGRNSNFRIYGE